MGDLENNSICHKFITGMYVPVQIWWDLLQTVLFCTQFSSKAKAELMENTWVHMVKHLINLSPLFLKLAADKW